MSDYDASWLKDRKHLLHLLRAVNKEAGSLRHERDKLETIVLNQQREINQLKRRIAELESK